VEDVVAGDLGRVLMMVSVTDYADCEGTVLQKTFYVPISRRGVTDAVGVFGRGGVSGFRSAR